MDYIIYWLGLAQLECKEEWTVLVESDLFIAASLNSGCHFAAVESIYFLPERRVARALFQFESLFNFPFSSKQYI